MDEDNERRRDAALKTNSFLKSALVLTVAGLFLRGTQTGFSVWLANRIGAQGMGLFQLACSIYMLAVTLSTSGITIAVTRIVSEQQAKNQPAGVKKAFRLGFCASLFLGVTAAVLLFFCADWAANAWLGEPRTAPLLKLFSFGIPFLSTAAVIRGYFLGLRRAALSVSGDVVEQLVAMAATVWLVSLCAPGDITAACMALTAGSVLSEILSCIYAFFSYLVTRQKTKQKAPRGIARQMGTIVLPVAVGNNIRSVLSSIENSLVPSGLKRYGAHSAQALAQYGMVKGMVLPLLTFPAVLLSPIASLLVPEVSAAAAVHNQKRVLYMTKRCLRLTLWYAFGIMGVTLLFADEIGVLFFQSTQVSGYLRATAPLIPLLYVDQIVDGILKGLNQQVASMKYNTADALMRTLLVFFLVPILGMQGYLFMLYAGTIFNASMSAAQLIRVSRLRIDLVRWILVPLLFCAVSCILTKLLIHVSVLVGAVFCLALYVGLLFLFGCFSKSDISLFRKKCQKKF